MYVIGYILCPIIYGQSIFFILQFECNKFYTLGYRLCADFISDILYIFYSNYEYNIFYVVGYILCSVS